MRRPPAALLILLLQIFLNSCTTDEPDEVFIDEAQFASSDMVILNNYLDLKATPFNYASLPLPEHYLEEEADEYDNTPSQNPVTNMGATLGRVLFYDKQLSVNNTISCASCHQQSAAFSDPARFSVGFDGGETRRNSMTLLNSRYYANGKFFWDERAGTLEEQVLIPIQDHIEMGLGLTEMESKLQALEYYPILFKNAFGSEQVTSHRISLALSQFIRSMVPYQSKFDKALEAAGNPEVGEQMPLLPILTDQENIGLDIFMRGRNGATCNYCHGTPMNINDAAKNNGLSLDYLDKGLGEITGNPADNAKFKVPSLRNIANTAPYMHDGRFATLMEVVNHYNSGVQQHPNLDFRLSIIDDETTSGQEPMRLNLTQVEKEALVAFLHTLTDEEILTDEKYSDPFK